MISKGNGNQKSTEKNWRSWCIALMHLLREVNLLLISLKIYCFRKPKFVELEGDGCVVEECSKDFEDFKEFPGWVAIDDEIAMSSIRRTTQIIITDKVSSAKYSHTSKDHRIRKPSGGKRLMIQHWFSPRNKCSWLWKRVKKNNFTFWQCRQNVTSS